MRRPAFLIAAGAAAFIVFLVAFLPASVLLRFLPAEVSLSGVEGTVWRGQAEAVAVRGRSVGALRWSNRPWRLLLLQLDYAVSYLPPGGQVDMDVTLRGPHRLDIANARGTLPIMALDGLLGPPGWKATAELEVQRLSLVDGFPESATGVLVLRELTAPRETGVNIGSFELTLGEGAVGSDSITGRLRDLGSGPMRVRATLELKPDRSYLLSGEVAAGPDAGAVVLRTLRFLGPEDSLGRRPFTVEGTL
jgi:general secretion pathway protein N